MREKPKVEVINKLTEAQIRDMRITEIEESVAAQDEKLLEVRNQMIDIKKEMVKINKNLTQINKTKNKG